MFSNLTGQFLFRFLTGVFTAVFALMAIPFPVNKELPSAPDDFTPVIRFAVTSDVHLDGDPEQPAEEQPETGTGEPAEAAGEEPAEAPAPETDGE